jgi:predicted polyphosphate/ATP-dependent NAD kinase
MRRVGFLINPVAGMGGPVGLKGTDGRADDARALGAKPVSSERAQIALRLLACAKDLRFFTCSGAMGEEALRECGIVNYEVCYRYHGDSSADDTKHAAEKFLSLGLDLVLFCGGDGTARDIFSVTGRRIPIIGIPAGVKMYSAVFAVSPSAAAEIAGASDLTLRDSEILDIDEDKYRNGSLKTRLFGYAKTPVLPGKVQTSKQVFEEQDEERAKNEIARFIGEVMLPDTLYILGAGTTTEAIARHIDIKKTLLGVDSVKDGRLVAADVNEQTLLRLTEGEKNIRIILSPIGAQGFILGRGNQQISPEVLRRAGTKNIIVVATPHKLHETPFLYVDSGDRALDREFGESIQVVSGYRIAQRKKIFQGENKAEPLQ